VCNSLTGLILSNIAFIWTFCFSSKGSCKRARTGNRVRSSVASLHVQLDNVTVKLALVLLKSDLDLGGDELLNDFRRATDEVAGVGEGVDLGEDGLEERPDLDALDQVVVFAFLLDDGAGLVGEHTDLLVGVLARVALLNHGHDDVLGCHLQEIISNILIQVKEVSLTNGSSISTRFLMTAG